MTAINELTELVTSLPNSSLLTDTMKQRALESSVVPDGSGVWPGQPGYVTTYDVYWAAISLLGFLQAQPVVRQSSSEGTSVAVDAPNWAGLHQYYRGLSRIASATAAPVLGTIPIPSTPHVVRTDMSGRYGDYDNVDTDVG